MSARTRAVLLAYAQRITTIPTGRSYDLASFTTDERIGLFLSVLTRIIDRQYVSPSERVAVLELLGHEGVKSLARICGDAVGDALGGGS